MRKISFLIPAHNEEKIIGRTLQNLIGLPYNNYEIIIGLDGCTDKTEEIVRNFAALSQKIKYYKINLRRGKPDVINEIIKKAEGDIIIINDADWIFKVKNEENLREFLSVFDNPLIGGIAESIPLEWDESKIKNGDLGFKMIAYSSYFWFEFQKKFLTERKFNRLFIKEPKMFLTNIFRKELYNENSSLGDDFERTYDIIKKGYKIVIFDNIEIPRMISVYNKVSVRDVFKQKIRTAMARKQLNAKEGREIGIKNYYLPSTFYIFFNSWKKGIYVGGIITLWIFIAVLGEIISKFKKIDTKKGWMLRMKR